MSSVRIVAILVAGLACTGHGRRWQMISRPGRSWNTAVHTKTGPASRRVTAVKMQGDDKRQLTLASPSKINLFLRITARRPDGFHDLASLFQATSFSDTLHMSCLPADAEDDEFDCDMEGVPLDRSNLVLRAVDNFREHTGLTQKFRIRLEKTVPAEAGLGGGSGNAATALFGCNVLCGKPASPAELEEWSKTLGSDAAFFMSQGTAYCTGRGEILEPLAAMPGQDLYIFKPEVGLSTPSVFKALDLDSRSREDPKKLLNLHTTGTSGQDKYVNDLETPALSLLPDLKTLKEKLMNEYGFDSVAMSGSGTSFFAIGKPTKELTEPLLNAPDLPWPVQVFKTSFINRPSLDVWYTC